MARLILRQGDKRPVRGAMRRVLIYGLSSYTIPIKTERFTRSSRGVERKRTAIFSRRARSLTVEARYKIGQKVDFWSQVWGLMKKWKDRLTLLSEISMGVHGIVKLPIAQHTCI